MKHTLRAPISLTSVIGVNGGFQFCEAHRANCSVATLGDISASGKYAWSCRTASAEQIGVAKREQKRAECKECVESVTVCSSKQELLGREERKETRPR